MGRTLLALGVAAPPGGDPWKVFSSETLQDGTPQANGVDCHGVVSVTTINATNAYWDCSPDLTKYGLQWSKYTI